MVNKDLGHHEMGDDNRDDHGIILVDEVDAFEVFVSECYRKEASRCLYVDIVDVNISDDMEMTLLELTRYPSIGKFAFNGVDYSSDLLGGVIILLLLRLMCQ